MRIRILTSLIICISQNAYAGAWAREKGELFIAAGGNFLLSSGAQLPVHYDPTLYAEFGATERLTFGLDLHTADKGRIGTVFIFTNFPIGDTEAQDRYSAGFALGARADAYHATETLLRGHVSWGRGIEDGWLAVDASATYGSRDRTFRPKVDATWVKVGRTIGPQFYNSKRVRASPTTITPKLRPRLSTNGATR